MDIQIGETPAGRIKMELFSDIVPKCVLKLSPLFANLNSTSEQRKTFDSSVRGSTGNLHFFIA